MPTLTPKPSSTYSRKHRKKLRRRGRKSTTKYASLFIILGIFMLLAGSSIFLFNSGLDNDVVASTTSWKEVTDPETGGIYFWNQATGETTWRRPRELEPFRPPPKRIATKSDDRRPEEVSSDSDFNQGVRQEEHSIPKHVPSTSNHSPPMHLNPIRPDSPKTDVNLDDTPTAPSRKPPPPSSKSSKCTAENVMTGTDLRGGDMPLPNGEVYSILSVESCCVTCRENVQCIAWVYQSTSKVCYLKNRESVEERGHVDLSAGQISGRTSQQQHNDVDTNFVNSAKRQNNYKIKDNHDDIEIPEAILNVYPDPESAAAGTFRDVEDPEILRLSDDLGRQRAEQVKKEFLFMWRNYEQRAWGMDELHPKTGRGNNNWGSMGVTLVDTLDTLWLMDLKAEFERASTWVRDQLNFNRVNKQMSFFETNIRMMGGLLSAHDLSGDQMFLDKALDLARRMLPGFNTQSGIPHAQIKLSDSSTADSWTRQNAVLAEFGTLQLEWRYLSEKTNDMTYKQKVEKIYDKLGPARLNGMWPTLANRNTGRPSSNVYTMGALSDSFYEYLLKMWLQGGKKETRWRKMYDEAIEGMTKHLLGQSGHLHFVGEKKGNRFVKKMEHLACFTGGMLALGAKHDPLGSNSERAQRDLRNAKSIAYTCYRMYRDMPSGLSPEFVTFDNNGHIQAGSAKYYILRPEAAETMFVLHQLTGHPVFRQWGWDMFKAIRSRCKTTYGFGNVPNVATANTKIDDRAESFFLAETMKYLYLLQLPRGEGSGGVPLDKYVFNTEAHPLSVFKED